jgi:hypothetical protein
MSDDAFLPAEEWAEPNLDDFLQNLNPLDDAIANAILSDDTLQQPPRKKLPSEYPSKDAVPSSLSIQNPNGEHSGSSDDSIGLSEEFLDSESRIDPTQEEEDQLDKVIASALQNMSLEEREKVVHDLHGVADVVDENPDFLRQQMQEMDSWLHRLKQKRGKHTNAFLTAEARDRYFVERLRLSFLRAEHFDSQKAAARLIRYFAFKRYLFGDAKLCKQIVYKDLDADDIRALKVGYMQTLPGRDRAGRAIFIYFPSHQEYTSMESLVCMLRRWIPGGVLFVFVLALIHRCLLLCCNTTVRAVCYFIASHATKRYNVVDWL